MVNGTAVPVCEVEHLKSVEWLQPEPLGGGTTLGLKLLRDQMGELAFRSGVPEVGEELTRRELFLLRGKLVGH